VETTLSMWVGGVVLLAADAAGAGGGGGGGAAETGPNPLMNLLFISCALIAIFYFMVMRPQSREQARRRAMLAAVKKNDRVVTAGGIYGVVTNVHQEADEVTVKVDEATNTKLRLTLSSIVRVLGDEPSDSSANK
jgi:preprotein translocase subunit YajC